MKERLHMPNSFAVFIRLSIGAIGMALTLPISSTQRRRPKWSTPMIRSSGKARLSLNISGQPI